MRKQLIINADDLGADEGRNEGIFEAIQAGVVTSVSILANGPALDDALQRLNSLRGRRISFGVHLNLSEGRPLSSSSRLLVGPEGSFLGKAAAHELLMGQGDPELAEEVFQELKAQVDLFHESGIPISHLDGHQHVHVFPAVIQAAVMMAKEKKIPWMRIPEEPHPKGTDACHEEEWISQAQTFNVLARSSRDFLHGSGVQLPDHFRGLYAMGRITLPILEKLLEELPHGLTELMVHPGRVPYHSSPGPFSAFSMAGREKELEALLDQGFRKALVKNGIILTPFPEARS